MKKKLVTLALSMVLCLSMGMTALAAPSPSATTQKGSDSEVFSALGVSGSGTEFNNALMTAINKAFPGTVTGGNLEWKGTYDLDPATDSKNGYAVIQDADLGAKAGESGWFLIHVKDDDKIEVLQAQVQPDGSLISLTKPDGFSPFGVVRVISTAAAGPSGVPDSGNAGPSGAASSNPSSPAGSTGSTGSAATPSTNNSGAAPKTGDFATPIVAEVVALMSVVGIALSLKKNATR